MYIPRHFEETSIDASHELISSWPLATLITHSASGINANHIPFVLQKVPGTLGKLQGHVPRANPVVAELQAGTEVLAIFHGPNGYISPSWYATKKETGRVVPTWNYAVVHAYGTPVLIEDGQWIHQQVEALTQSQEQGFVEPWQVDDAPEDFTDRLIQNLVGLEIEITRVLAKTKASQNQPARNQRGVVAGLHGLGNRSAEALAETVVRHGNQD